MLGQTASIYRHGNESSGGTVYNYTTETTTNIKNVFEEGDEFVETTNLTVQAKSTLTPAFVPTTTLADGDYIRARYVVPSGFTLKVWQAGVTDTTWSAPAGLDCWLRVESEGAETRLAGTTQEIATDLPLASVDGADAVAFQVENGTGAEVDASGYFAFTLEPTEEATA